MTETHTVFATQAAMIEHRDQLIEAGYVMYSIGSWRRDDDYRYLHIGSWRNGTRTQEGQIFRLPAGVGSMETTDYGKTWSQH